MSKCLTLFAISLTLAGAAAAACTVTTSPLEQPDDAPVARAMDADGGAAPVADNDDASQDAGPLDELVDAGGDAEQRMQPGWCGLASGPTSTACLIGRPCKDHECAEVADAGGPRFVVICDVKDGGNGGRRPPIDGCGAIQLGDWTTHWCCPPACVRDTRHDYLCTEGFNLESFYSCPTQADGGIVQAPPDPRCFKAQLRGDTVSGYSMQGYCCP